ncbi:phage scaffolding protein [[Clostridium] innocuum]|nr:phage scaffolding protein [[Clostridium] innocuum]MCR0327607.1 phage scaffolding protein [[Clostridium] innocuum]
MEWIKTILEKCTGEDGKLNLAEAIKEINKQAPDNVVPKDQYNTVAEAKKQLDKDVKARDKQLEDLKKAGSVEDLQQQLNAAQEANKQAKKEYDAAIANMKYDAAIEKALANAVHPDLMSGRIDRAKLKIKEDGSIEGLEDQVKSLKETYKDLFKTKTGKTPPEGDDPNKKPEDMSYEDFVNQLENGE